ncbi:hypothetical protein EYR41_009699 [Orbilia oligospora]|uniref:Uncharacterized protein n=1 Tax=Orbilia oligospora TaxID=2813651 RepID=A0A8H2DVR5_ORBOL|nr:hypothetical protein EYR41_009699 [Orbilia oligospora]
MQVSEHFDPVQNSTVHTYQFGINAQGKLIPKGWATWTPRSWIPAEISPQTGLNNREKQNINFAKFFKAFGLFIDKQVMRDISVASCFFATIFPRLSSLPDWSTTSVGGNMGIKRQHFPNTFPSIRLAPQFHILNFSVNFTHAVFGRHDTGTSINTSLKAQGDVDNGFSHCASSAISRQIILYAKQTKKCIDIDAGFFFSPICFKKPLASGCKIISWS